MGIFNRYRKRKLEIEILKAEAKKLDIEAREQQAEVRRRRKDALDMKKEIELIELQKEKAIKNAELNDILSDIAGDDDENNMFGLGAEELMLAKLLGFDVSTLLNSSSGIVPTNNPTPPPPGVPLDFSHVDKLLGTIPEALLKKARKLKPQDLQDIIRQKAPDFSQEEIDYAVEKINKM